MKLKDEKYDFIHNFAKALGFRSLNDFHTIISRRNFTRALKFLQRNSHNMIRLFRNKRLHKRVRKRLTEEDTIRLFKTLCKSVKRIVYSRKVNVIVDGRRTSRYIYRLCR